jgi:hypothetical protein
MESATGDSVGKIAVSESIGLLIEVIHLSVRRVKTVTMDCCFGLYHENFHMSGDGETFFHAWRFRDYSTD